MVTLPLQQEVRTDEQEGRLTSPRYWRCDTTRVCGTGWRSPTLHRSGFAGPNIFLPLAIFSGRGLATHNYNQQVGEMGIELLTYKVGPHLQRSGEHFEGALKAQEESTSAEGRLTEEDVLSVGASGKEENEHTQEWWEGYDPGMDASF